jgi:hypothetical protein
VVVSVSRGQGIQTRAFFCDDGAGRVCRMCAEERSAYAIGLKAGEQAPADVILPTEAELNMMAQKYFKQQGSGDRQGWDLAFENGYADGLKKTHGR